MTDLFFQNRPYQTTAIRAILDEFERGIRSTALVMATGLGKTVIFAQIAKDQVRRIQKPALILAHRSELLDQSSQTLQAFGLQTAFEKAEMSAQDAKNINAVVASVQTLSQSERLKQYAPDHFSLIVTDEAHHSVGKSYLKIYDYFKDTKHLGVTATPLRHDKVGLKNVFQTVAFQYSIQQGIEEKYLCELRGARIRVDGLDLESVKIVSGDFSSAELDEILMQEKILQKMVLPVIEHAQGRPTICFTSSVEHAHAITKCFNRVTDKLVAVAVDGAMDDKMRKQQIELFTAGRAQFIVNCNVLTEGFDYPPTAAIALFRPTKSLGLLAQMVGRGTRIFDNKTDCLVLDFVGAKNSVRTANFLDVLDGSILSDDEQRKAQELLETGEPATTALLKAKLDVARQDQIKAKMRAFTTSNAFDVAKLFALPSCKGLYGGGLATLAQRGVLENAGIKFPNTLEKGEASQLIAEIIKRRERGLATFKQMKYLKRLGFDLSDFETLTFEEAKTMISAKVPPNHPFIWRRMAA